MHFRLGRNERGQNASQPQRLLAESRTHPVLSGGRGIALVEYEVDDLEHRGQALRPLFGTRHLELDVRLRERSFGAHDALPDRRFRNQKSARYFRRGQAAEQAKRQSGARLGRQHRMTGHEGEAQHVVADVIIHGLVGRGARLAHERRLVRDRGVLVFYQPAPPQFIERTVLRRGHQPGPRIVRWTGARPLLQRRYQCVLRHFFGETHVAQHSREPRDDLGRLHAPDRLDGAMNGGPVIQSRGPASQCLSVPGIRLRRLSICSRNSGVSPAPQYSIWNTGRISISDSPGIGFGQRFNHSTASSMVLTCQIQKPAMSSLVSAKGPSMTVRLGPENRTRLPWAVGRSPSAARSTPALTRSSLNCPMARNISSLGGTPASLSTVALTITRTFIGILLLI